jgi:hypothetical protein
LECTREARFDVLCHYTFPETVETLHSWFRRICSVHTLTLCMQTLEVCLNLLLLLCWGCMH